MTFAKIIFLIVMMWGASAWATIRYVSPTGTAQYITIAAALSASVTADTILIGPGVYNEGMTFSTRRTVIGAGWDQTHLSGQIAMSNANLEGTVIEGIHFLSTLPCFNFGSNSDSITVRRCRMQTTTNVTASIFGTGHTIEDCVFLQAANFQIANVSTGRVVFRNCLFVHYNGANDTRYAISGNNGNLEVYNCVFLGLRRILNCTGAQPVVFVNNIVYDWSSNPSYGIYLVGSMFDHNASDAITPPGTNAILLTADPFANYDEVANWAENTSDLHPAPGAPIIDAGHPDITDLDTTASDLGIYGGPRPLVNHGAPSYPFAISLTTTPILIGIGDTVQVNSSGRVGPRY